MEHGEQLEGLICTDICIFSYFNLIGSQWECLQIVYLKWYNAEFQKMYYYAYYDDDHHNYCCLKCGKRHRNLPQKLKCHPLSKRTLAVSFTQDCSRVITVGSQCSCWNPLKFLHQGEFKDVFKKVNEVSQQIFIMFSFSLHARQHQKKNKIAY